MEWKAHKLVDLLPSLDDEALADLSVTGVVQDSRDVSQGQLFIARSGLSHKGIDFIDAAADAGAVAALLDRSEYESRDWSIPVIAVDDLPQQAGLIAARFYGNPSHEMRVIGVTGTNGKTSCCHFIAQAMQMLGHRAAVIGTVGNGFIGQLQTASHTTPDAIGLQRMLAELRAEDAEVVVMEVSSHALEQGRVSGVEFDIALFTNLSRDHLDYHGSFEAYGAAKAKLFTDYEVKAAAVWTDDPFGQQLHAALADNDLKLLSVGKQSGQLTADSVNLTEKGIQAKLSTPWGIVDLDTPVVGAFNLSNLMLCAAALGLSDCVSEDLSKSLSSVQPVVGRMHRFGGYQQPLVVVDYAHTPDALEQALQALREHCQARLVCVFGCGGDRDNGKRPQMASVAEQLADVVVVTSDNPRTEDPQVIIEMVVEGLSGPEQAIVEVDRAAAIRHAIAEAKPGDIVLVAGKGHEDYQEVNGQRHHFSDLEQVETALQERLS